MATLLMFAQINVLRTLFASVEIALKQIQRSNADIEEIRDCLGNVDILCGKALATLGQLDKVVSNVKRTSNNSSGGGPARTKWMIHRLAIKRLQTQLVNLTSSLAMTLQILQGVHGNIKTDLVLSQVKLLVEDSVLTATYRDDILNLRLQQLAAQLTKPAESPVSTILRSPFGRPDSASSATWSEGTLKVETEMFEKETLPQALPESNETSTSVVSLTGTLVANLPCESFCQCQ